MFDFIKRLFKRRKKVQIGRLIPDYHEEINFDDTIGTIEIKGDKKLPYHKDIWLGSPSTGGSPVMESINEIAKNEEFKPKKTLSERYGSRKNNNLNNEDEK
jgi:hypothetical protein